MTRLAPNGRTHDETAEVDLHTAGAPVPAGLAARAAERERRRRQLPAHGGDALCQSCLRQPGPAVAWSGRFACERHAGELDADAVR